MKSLLLILLLISQLSFGSSFDSFESKFAFNQSLDVNHNRGVFSTSIPIPLPSNLLLKSITLKYHSNNTVNLGYGVGMSLSLPKIEYINGDYFYSDGDGAGKLIKTSDNIYRLDIDSSFSKFIKKDDGWSIQQANGLTWLLSRNGRTDKLLDTRGNELNFYWENGALSSVATNNWEVRVIYHGQQKYPKFLLGHFHTLPQGISQIEMIYRGVIKRTLNFVYLGASSDLLAEISEGDGQIKLFSGTYDLIKPPKATEKSNNRTYNDKIQTVFIDDKEAGEKIKPEDKTHYLDVNGDGWTDKIIENGNNNLDIKINVNAGAFITDNTISFPHSERGLKFADLNGDGVLDIISCPTIDFELTPDNVVSVNNVIQSNYILSVLKRMGKISEKFYDVYENIGGAPSVLTSKIDESKVEGNNIYDNTALGATRYEESKQDFTCNQYSIFKDINDDGITDVISGNVIYLRGRDKEATIVPIDINTLFEADQTFNLTQDYLSISDSNGDKKLEISPIVEEYYTPQLGTRTIVRKGNDETGIPPLSTPTLVKLISNFGGEKKVKYKYNFGAWVVSSIKTNAIVGKGMTEIFDYGNAPILDRLTGKFIGFPKVTKKIIHDDNIRPTLIEENIYLKDLEKDVLFAGSRGRLQGLLFSKSTFSPASEAIFTTTFTWDFEKLSKTRIHPYIKFTKSEETYRENGASQIAKFKVIKTSYRDWFSEQDEKIAPKDIETQTYGDGLHSVHTDDLLGFSNYEIKNNRYDETSNRILIERRQTLGKDHSFIQNEETYEYDESGCVIKQCFGLRCVTLDNDSKGRVIKKSTTNGKIETYSYIDDTPLVHEVTSDDIQKQYQYDPVTGDLQWETNEFGTKSEWSYLSPGIINKTTVDGITRFELNKIDFNKREIIFHRNDSTTTLYTDGFGRVLQSMNRTENKTHYSGEKSLDAHGNVLSQKVPSFDIPSDNLWYENTYDAFGRLIRTLDNNNNTLNISFNKEGVRRVTNEEIVFETTSNAIGNIYYTNYNGEKHNYNYDSIGQLISVGNFNEPDHDYTWSINSYGEIDQSNITNNFNSSQKTVFESTYDEQGLWAKRNNFIMEFNKNGQFSNSLRENITPLQLKTDLYESVLYERGHAKTINFNNAPQGNYEITYQYDNEARITQLETTLGYKQHYAYNNNGKLIVAKGDFLNTNLEYDGEQITKIDSIVNEIKYDVIGNITQINYSNGVTINRDYIPYTSLLRSIEGFDSEKRIAFTEYLERNRANKVVKKVTNGSEHNFHYDESHQISPTVAMELFRFDSSSLKVKTLEQTNLVWNDQNLVRLQRGQATHQFQYDHNGQITTAQGNGKSFIRINDDFYIVNGHKVSRIKINGITLLIQIDEKSYPVVEDHLGSIRAMFSPEGQLIWTRNYSTWGEKDVIYSDLPDAEALEEITIFSYARLIEIPFNLNSNISTKKQNNLYWSRSRVYSARIKQWLSYDPQIIYSPKFFIENPGNWYGLRYCNNDPVNCIDPSGYMAQQPGIVKDKEMQDLYDPGYGTDPTPEFIKIIVEDSEYKARMKSNITGNQYTVTQSQLYDNNQQQFFTRAVATYDYLNVRTTVQKNGGKSLGIILMAGGLTFGGMLAFESALPLLIAGTMEANMALVTAGSYVAKNPYKVEAAINNSIDFIDSFSGSLGGPTTGHPPYTIGGGIGGVLGYILNEETFK